MEFLQNDFKGNAWISRLAPIKMQQTISFGYINLMLLDSNLQDHIYNTILEWEYIYGVDFISFDIFVELLFQGLVR